MKYLQESRDDETDSQMGENTCIVGKVKYRVVNILKFRQLSMELVQDLKVKNFLSLSK